MNKIRPIDANNLSEEISSLSIRLANKDLFPGIVKSSVLQIIHDQATIPCSILLDATVTDTLAYAIKILTNHSLYLSKELDCLLRLHNDDKPISEIMEKQNDLDAKIRSVQFALDKLKEQD